MKNLELKSHWKDLDSAKLICRKIGAVYSGKLVQTDTFFNLKERRLKLRNINGEKFELIYYHRPDSRHERESEYEIVKLKNEKEIIKMLKDTLGIRGVVKKTRLLYLWQNVRIHLDEVKGLGKFLEFEIVCSSKQHFKDAPKKMKFLKKKFAIKQKDLISSSYIDLISKRLVARI